MTSDGIYDTFLPCDEKCEVPKGLRVSEVPWPSHKWSDILCCPHCGRAWLIIKEPEESK